MHLPFYTFSNSSYIAMEMFSLLEQKTREIIKLSDDQFNLCRTIFKPRRLKRRQYLLQEGDVCRYQVFVEKGMMRSFTIDERGVDHILQFAPEGWWISDLYSFFTQEPSSFHIEALEDSQLLLLDLEAWNMLLKDLPPFERYFRILIQNHLIATQRRVLDSMSRTAEEKYQGFLDQYPDCVQRVPQHMIASFLGLTPETLSRLRNSSQRRPKS